METHRPGRPGSRAATRSGTATACSASPSTSGDGDTIVFTHTEVDPDAGQSGLGGTLVRAALDDVRGRGGSVVAEVPVRARLDRAAPGVRRPRGAPRTGDAPAEPTAASTSSATRTRRSPSLEYGDYECPYCAAAAPVLRQLVEESDGRGPAGLPQLPARRPPSVRADRGAGRRGRRRAGRASGRCTTCSSPGRTGSTTSRCGRTPRNSGSTASLVVGERRPGVRATRSRPTSPPASTRAWPAPRPSSSTAGCSSGRVEAGALRRAIAGRRTAQARTAGSSQGRGGSDGGPSVLRRAQREPLPEDPQQDDAERSLRPLSRPGCRSSPARAARSSAKARSAMNSEIVKPIPARVAPAMRCDQRTPPGSTPQPGAQRDGGAGGDADRRCRRAGRRRRRWSPARSPPSAGSRRPARRRRWPGRRPGRRRRRSTGAARTAAGRRRARWPRRRARPAGPARRPAARAAPARTSRVRSTHLGVRRPRTAAAGRGGRRPGWRGRRRRTRPPRARCRPARTGVSRQTPAQRRPSRTAISGRGDQRARSGATSSV